MMPGLVCKHVSRENAPALLVCHQTPESAGDSGFLIACGADGHGLKDWLVADLDKRLQAPEMQELRTLEEGQQATRTAPDQPWVIEPLPPEEEAA